MRESPGNSSCHLDQSLQMLAADMFFFFSHLDTSAFLKWSTIHFKLCVWHYSPSHNQPCWIFFFFFTAASGGLPFVRSSTRLKTQRWVASASVHSCGKTCSFVPPWQQQEDTASRWQKKHLVYTSQLWLIKFYGCAQISCLCFLTVKESSFRLLNSKCTLLSACLCFGPST